MLGHVSYKIKYFNGFQFTGPIISFKTQMQRLDCVLVKSGSENVQQIYRRTPMRRYDFNKVALQLY